jgi:hypothetical protein
MQVTENDIAALQKFCKEELQTDIPATTYDVLLAALAQHINQLIQNSFEQLVHLLYRIDVDEKKLKTVLLNNSGRDAGILIAELIINRQLQKIQSRDLFTNDDTIPEEEKW